jgi:sigma-B regulation protein RsbU (phosphoserine phosphatase)
MEITFLENIQNRLIEKQHVLLDWLHKVPPSKKTVLIGPSSEKAVHTHLYTIENCIDRAEAGTLGICEVCQEYVETDLLEVDYTACICLEHYSQEEMRRLEDELELAQTVQRTLLPQEVPDFPEMEIAVFSKPAQIVGGDYFDFFRLMNGDYGFVIADVAGHGISAGLHMASIQAMLRSIVSIHESPAGIIKQLHHLFIHNIRFTTFVSIFMASFNPSTRTLTYINAGHNPPILVRKRKNKNEVVQLLRPTAAAIGLIERANFEEKTIDLENGDVLVMYTDGVIEAISPEHEQFGNHRLIKILKASYRIPPVDAIRGIRVELDRFTRDQPIEDDTTLMIARIR